MAHARRVKNVIVVGGGPGGLAAAAAAASKGHRVTLYEKSSRLGAKVRAAEATQRKGTMSVALSVLRLKARRAGVKIERRVEANPQLVEQERPDVVIIATGELPFLPRIPGVDKAIVFAPKEGQASEGTRTRRPNVVVLGGGLVGREIADFLAQGGYRRTRRRIRTAPASRQMMEEALDTGNWASDMLDDARPMLMMRLREKDVGLLTQTDTANIYTDGVVVPKGRDDAMLHGIDCVVLPLGASALEDLGAKRLMVSEVHVIGDAREPQGALDAIAEGTEVGRSI
jgi:NADPH-dependent 2,4-dienoyl-CoA reductase/sulfur reductase-like enzyme